ncbi:hypothetical protein [Saccharopolyspora sp. NPDC003762]
MTVAVAVQSFAGRAGAMPLAGLAANGSVAAVVGDVAQLLDVDVHQLAWCGAFS